MVTYEFKVENIKCMGCVNNIRENLMQQEGVFAVEVNQAAQQVSVTAIAVERKLLADRLKALGYPEKGHNGLLNRAKTFLTCAFQK